MAEAPISPLNKLFQNLAKSLNEDDVNEMKNLLRGEQVSKEDMDKLTSALDIFHHLKGRGYIDGNNLDLLVQLFEEMGKEALKERICKFQSEHSCTTENPHPSKVGEDIQVSVPDQEHKIMTPSKFSIPRCITRCITLIPIVPVSVAIIAAVSSFIFCSVNGILLALFLAIAVTFYFYQLQREMAVVSSACRATWRRDTVCGKWEAFVMDRVEDKQQAKNLLQQSKFDPVVDALRQEEFFFPSLVYFWFENSFTFPPTVTKATEYAVIHHADMYCKENNLKVENLREILKADFNDIGKYLYDHITEANVGKLYPSWIDKSISNLESHCFGLLTKSVDCYTFQSKYVYSYMIATYLSIIVASSPNNIPMLLREEKTNILQAKLSYCFPYVIGILGEKASYFLKEVVKLVKYKSL
ncbi:uncharacterized protein [Ptychodera flava]|uniref:uncharacterized protein isoform X2 n=1 Tax=Ptychodera flava TaxID=63121 RepID=UPI00396A5D88